MRQVVPLEFEDLRLTSEEVLSEEAFLVAPSALGEQPEREALATLEARLQALIVAHDEEIERVRRETGKEVRRELAEELQEKIEWERTAVLRVCESFASERRRYFAAVEAEVVQLSLAIAARVLHREAEMDPLLLQGAVKVALDKMQANESVSLRVPEGQVEEWKRIFVEAQHEDVGVTSDNRLQVGECVLETNVGRVELGVSAQLKEIEKGFFDLLQQRPA